MIDDADVCWHCGEALAPGERFSAVIAGSARAMCCMGCLGAAQWIENLGLADYYRLRSAPAPRLSQTAPQGTSPVSGMLGHVVRDLQGARREVLLSIDGVRCAACVWLIERTLTALPGIESVEVNASSRRARIVWRGDAAVLPLIIDALLRIGYAAVAMDSRALDDARRLESRRGMKRLLVAGFGAMQAMMYASAPYLGAADHMDSATRDWFRWLSLLASTPVVCYSAQDFFIGAGRGLRARIITMDVPVALAIALIYAASLVEAVRGGTEVYFESVSMFVFLLLAGRYLEMRARHRSLDLGDALARLTPGYAHRVRDDETNAAEAVEQVSVHELRAGDRVHVFEGGLVPADGVLDSERCHVNEALLTGESAPQERHRGQRLLAGSVLMEGPVRMTVKFTGAGTVVAGIGALMARAQSARPRLAQLGERAASRFVMRVLTISVLTACCWLLIRPERAFAATVAVLVVSCPCALALAIPAAITRSLGVLAHAGVFVAKPDAIEIAAKATHVIFDKTGTLTDPHLALDDIRTFGRCDGAQALQLAAALARHSRHPIAQAIAAAAGDAGGHATQVAAHPGGGLEGWVQGQRLRLGRFDFAMPAAAQDEALGEAVVLSRGRELLAAFRIGERLRTGALEAMSALRAQGLRIEILSGDSPDRVRAVAGLLGIERWKARQLPQDKLARLSVLRAQGAVVIAVGDGINDAPVLAGADVSIAVGGGADLALAVSDVMLGNGRLDGIAGLRSVARHTLRTVQQNQRWTWAYNLVGVPLAALGFVPPWLAALGMSFSSLVVILNALRIRAGDTATPASSEDWHLAQVLP